MAIHPGGAEILPFPHAAEIPQPGARARLARRHLWIVAAIAVPAAFAVATLGAVDLAYQVRLGRIMLQTHHLIRTDAFTFTAPGRPWTDQQWLAQLLFAVAFRAGGWASLAALHAVMVGGAAALVLRACRAAGASHRTSSLLALGSLGVALPNLAMRPQALAALLFAAVVWLLWERGRRPGLLWVIPAILAVWANVHGTFALGLLLVLLAAGEDLVHRRRASGRRLLAVGAVGAVATLANPFGIRVWSYVVTLSTNHEILRSVSEWQPPSILRATDAGFFASIAVVAVILARRRRSVGWYRLLWLGAFFALALPATRGALWWGLVAGPVLATILPARPVDAERVRTQRRTWRSTAVAAALAASVLAAFPWSFAVRPALTPGSRMLDAPGALTERLRRILRPGERIFAAQALGSWVEFALPGHPVAVDSRIELYPPFVWDRYRLISSGSPGWFGALEVWGVRTVLVRRDQQAGLFDALVRSPDWRRVQADPGGAIFVRRGS